jgi:phosphocarrier protein
VKQITEDIVVTDPLGIHARPAAALAVAVGRSGARATLHFNGKKANAASVVQLLQLGVTVNSRVSAEIEGEDVAIATVTAALREHLSPAAP